MAKQKQGKKYRNNNNIIVFKRKLSILNTNIFNQIF